MPRGRTCQNLERDAEIYRLWTKEGIPHAEIGRRLGVTVNVVSLTVMRIRRQLGVCAKPGRPAHEHPLEAQWEADDTTGARCRCGLRLPCNNCLPDAAKRLADRRLAVDVL